MTDAEPAQVLLVFEPLQALAERCCATLAERFAGQA
jgi:hypothetical protein